jgi:hypothetical protein
MGSPLGGFTVGQFIKQFGQNLWAEVQTVYNAIANFATRSVVDVSGVLSDLQGIHDDWQELKLNLQTEVDKLKSFQFDVRWKTRVIHVPTAVDQIKNLVDEIFHQLIDKLDEVLAPLKDLTGQIEELTRKQSTTEDQVTTLAKIEGGIAFVQAAVHNTRQAMDSVKDLSELFLDITNRIETGSDLFLQQGNPRVRLKGKISAREGKLHAAA